jgi:cytochrome c oxidase cbb3-type subunit 3
MTHGWSAYVIFIVVLNVLGCAWLLYVNRKAKIKPGQAGEPVGHEFDGIKELNNPLPAWWTWLFVLTIGYAAVYLVFYPGLGSFAGTLGWTSGGQWEGQIADAKSQYGPIYARYFEKSIPELLSESPAIEMGGRLFANNCSACHGSDARGGEGYPNLTDDDWLYGGAPETIVQTITHGRNGMMPPLGGAIGGEPGIKQVAQYVLSLSGRSHDAKLAEQGKVHFTTICAVCHLKDGTGNPAVGAPNLTNGIWLHGGRVTDIEDRVRNGKNSKMPAHGEILEPEKIHLLALYVYSLSNSPSSGD